MRDREFDLQACLRLVQQRDEAAARELVAYLYPLLLRIVVTRLPRRDSEEDLVQEILVKMFTRLDQYRGEVPFEHWISRIAVNHCLNALRAQTSRPEWRWADLSAEQAEVLDAVLTANEDSSDPSGASIAREIVEKLLETLKPEDRMLIQMLELEDRSIEEVRQLTGWSSTRIRVRAFRARKKLNASFRRLKLKL